MRSHVPTPDTSSERSHTARHSSGPVALARAEQISLATAFVIGVLYLLAALRLPLWMENQPGPGLFPIAIAAILIVCPPATLVTRRRLKRKPSVSFAGDDEGDSEREFGPAFWKIPALVACLIGYVVVLERLGHLVSSALLVWVTLITIGGRSWWQQVSLAALLAIGSFALFDLIFGVPLPSRGF